MAYFVCHKHGGRSAASVCEHLAMTIVMSTSDHDSSGETLYPVRANYEGQEIGPTWLCATCAAIHGVPAEGLELQSESGLERFWNVIGFTPVCRKCFEETFGR